MNPAEIREQEGKALLAAITKANLTQAELAYRLAAMGDPATPDVVSNMILGRTRIKPDRKALIAAALRTTVADIFEPPAQKESASLAQGFGVRAAIRSWRGAMAGNHFDECRIELEEAFIEVPVAFLVGGLSKIDLHDAWRVAGRSMEPRIEPGSVVIIYRDEVRLRNTIVMAESPDGNVFVKVLRVGADGRYQLHSISENGSTFEDLDGWKVYGHAVAIIHDEGRPGPNVEWHEGRALRA